MRTVGLCKHCIKAPECGFYSEGLNSEICECGGFQPVPNSAADLIQRIRRQLK